MSGEKPYQPSEEEMKTAEDMMNWEQKSGTHARNADALAKKEGSSLSEFFAPSRYSLHVYEYFLRDILPFAKENEDSDISAYNHIDFPRGMTSRDLLEREKFRNANPFTLNQIRAFIEAQSVKDDTGPLSTKLHVSNLFRVRLKKRDGYPEMDTVTITSLGGTWSVDGGHFRLPVEFPKGVRLFSNGSKE